MRRISLVLFFAFAVICLINSSAQAALFFDTRSAWELAVASFADVTIGGLEYEVFSAGTPFSLPYGRTVTANIDLVRLQVPTSWATWSGGNTPAVLYTNGQTSVTGTFGGGPVQAFGLEMEPNTWSDFEMTLLLSDGTSLTQIVNGAAGARFFGWTSDLGVTSLTLSCLNDDFAFGRMVIGQLSTQPIIPEPTSMSLLGIGLLGLFGFKKRKKV